MAEEAERKTPGGSRGAPTTPEEYLTTGSSRLPSGDYSYVLEIVMNMQASMGRVEEAVATLKTQSADQGAKLASLS